MYIYMHRNNITMARIHGQVSLFLLSFFSFFRYHITSFNITCAMLDFLYVRIRETRSCRVGVVGGHGGEGGREKGECIGVCGVITIYRGGEVTEII